MSKPYAKLYSPLISNLTKGLAGAILLSTGILPVPTVLAAQTAEPTAPWVYDAITQLVNEGLLDLPKRPLNSYSRQELGELTAKALTKLEDTRNGALLREYGHISGKIAMVEAQLKLAKEYEKASGTTTSSAQPAPSRQNSQTGSMGTPRSQTENLTMELVFLQKRQQDLFNAIIGTDEIKRDNSSRSYDYDKTDETNRLASLMNSGDSKIKLAAEQENTARLNYYSTRINAARATELYLRNAIRGENRLELMKPLKDKSDEAQTILENAAWDYIEARKNTEGLLNGNHHEKQTNKKDTAIDIHSGNEDSTSEREYISSSDMFGRLSRLLIMDEINLKLAKEQEKTASNKYNSARIDAVKAAEAYTRVSLDERTQNGTVHPMKSKYDDALSHLEFTALDYAAARSRTIQRENMLDYLQKRHHELLTSPDNPDLNSSPVNSNTGKKSTGKPADYDSTIYAPPVSPVSASALDNAVRLRAEFISELDDNSSLDNMNARQQLASNMTIKEVPEKRFTADVELRIDTGHHSGEDGIGNRTRVRARVYPDYNIDGNWHAKGMIEWEKTIAGPQSSDDGKVKLDRYYLSGNIGAVHTDIGAFGSLMAEGNIYDSKFKGVRFTVGDPVKYNMEYGKVDRDNMDRSYNVTASYDAVDYKVEGGYYRFEEKNGNNRNIFMANYRQPVGIFDAGAMLLYGKDSGKSGRTGYVLSLDYIPANSWQPYTYTGWLKYYYQPYSTYVSHTMNGMADVMSLKDGFKGWGIGFNYNLPDAWTISFEFYSLKNLLNGKRSNTVWSSVNKYLSVH